jgi:hypothetical protein
MELRPGRLCWLDLGDSDFGPQCKTRSMRLILNQVGILSLDGCAYSSHSGRISSLSEHLHVAKTWLRYSSGLIGAWDPVT